MNCGTYCNLSRAVEVALCGNFTIDLTADKIDFPSVDTEIPFIKSYYHNAKFVPVGDIKVELYRNDFTGNQEGENFSAIIERVSKYEITICDNKLNADSTAMLKNAYNMFKLAPNEYDKIVNIASVIANIGKSKNIEACHIAEAIGYIIREGKSILPVYTFGINVNEWIFKINESAITPDVLNQLENYITTKRKQLK